MVQPLAGVSEDSDDVVRVGPPGEALVFSTGLTKSGHVVTANLSTGIAGGQTVIGGTGAGESLTYSSTTSGTKGTHIWGSTTGMVYDEAQARLLIGTTTPFTQAVVEVTKTQNAGSAFTFVNESAGGSAYTAFFLAQSQNLSSGATFGTFLFSSGSTLGSPYGANNGLFELAGGLGNMHFWIQQGVGDFAWWTGITFPNPLQVMKVTNAGLFRVGANTGSFPPGALGQFNRTANSPTYLIVSNASAGGAAEATLILSQSETTYTNYLSAGIMGSGFTTIGPFQASGAAFEHVTNTTAPMFFSAYGGQPIDFYTTTGRNLRFRISSAGEVQVPSTSTGQGWYGVDGANFERVTATWGSWSVSGTTSWIVAASAGGAGTVRDIAIDAGVANAYLFGAVSSVYGDSSNNRVTVSGALGVEAGAGFARASAAGMLLDAISVVNTAAFSITGGTNITTATGVNFVNVARPTYDGAGVAKTVLLGATVYIKNAPLLQNGLTLAGGGALYALWIDDGFTRMDGSAAIGFGASGGYLEINGAGVANNTAFSVGHINDSTRDHVFLGVGGGNLYDHPNNDFVHVSPTNTAIAGADFGGTGILTTVRIDGLTYSALSGSPSITAATTLYLANAPTLSGVTGASYALWVDAGVCRLDGQVALGGGANATLGTIGGSGPGTAAQNKWLPVNSDGTTYYVPLWI
jgi:hypothetical protein